MEVKFGWVEAGHVLPTIDEARALVYEFLYNFLFIGENPLFRATIEKRAGYFQYCSNAVFRGGGGGSRISFFPVFPDVYSMVDNLLQPLNGLVVKI